MSEPISRARFRTIYNRCIQEVLAPAGFVWQGALVFRHQGDQVTGFYLQFDREEYTIEIGFHYDFLPAFAGNFARANKSTLDNFDIVDFLFRIRLAHLTGQGGW